jgi:hypothetical protein
MTTRHFLVQKHNLHTTTLVETPDSALGDGQVRVHIERFALTANNITYAAFGDAMNYWQFFPTGELADGGDAVWGRIPVWGFGSVVQSSHPGVALGERLYGYFPMSSSVVLQATRLAPGSFVDGAAHRATLHPVYNQYQRCNADPFYAAPAEDAQALLRPLFTTAWLIDDFLADNDFFGATSDNQRPAVLLSSASSKTASATAYWLHQRSGIEVVGLTSPANLAYCESLGCYHRVLAYDQLDSLAADRPSVYVDFAGNAALRLAIHTRFTRLAYSCAIGGTHIEQLGAAKALPGPKATLFFAPAQIKKRSTEWGPAEFGQRMVQAWQTYLATACNPAAPWLVVARHSGAAQVNDAYAQVLGGKGDPRLGHMLTL